MMRFPFLLLLVSLLFQGLACRQNPDIPGEPANTGPWLISESQVLDGGPGKDGIPAIDNPDFTSVESGKDLLGNDELVVGFKYGNTIRAYPHIILDWHEIVNDEIDDLQFSCIYCPLTGSATIWNRIHEGKESTFGVSGLLYNTNIIPYDRKSNSNWSQMRLQCVNGERSGEVPETFQVVETSWQNWKSMYPESEILSTNTGFNRNYGRYPYGSYRTSDQLIFPVEVLDDRLHEKERTLAVIVNGEAKGYPIQELGQSEFDESITVIEETFEGIDLVVAGSSGRNFAVAYNRRMPGGTLLQFEAIDDGTATILRDQEGNEWDIFGAAVSGPRQGQQLQRVESFIAYWFAWGTFYPNLELHEG